MTSERFFDANRRNWEDRVPIHLRDATGFYKLEDFLAGRGSLGAIEADEIGEVRGKHLLHLQCHFGLDTLVLARAGAEVSGLDFSPSAIAAARELASRVKIAATFVEGNVYDAPTLTPGPFDIVFTTWGTIIWLPDLARWAKVVATVLRPGGFLYFADGHPGLQALTEIDGRLVITYPWRTTPEAPIEFDNPTTYNDDPTVLANFKTFEWTHPISEIVSVLTNAGLNIEMLHEHECLPWQHFPMMVKTEDGRYRLPDAVPPIPLAVSLRARKVVT
jgi:SAM-dependent methyltransferase